MTSVESIDTQLKSMNLLSKKIPGDGNCQFAAISYCMRMYGIDLSTDKLRRNAIKYIVKHKSRFKHYVHNITMKQYIDRLRKGEYGDHITMVALSELYNLTIYVLRHRARRNIINENFDLPVVLIYTGDDGDDAHYDATKPNKRLQKYIKNCVKKFYKVKE